MNDCKYKSSPKEFGGCKLFPETVSVTSSLKALTVLYTRTLKERWAFKIVNHLCFKLESVKFKRTRNRCCKEGMLGYYYNKKTGQEWLAGPDINMSWYQATKWVRSLGGGFRQPAKKELETLYKKGHGTRNLHTALKTTGWYVWSCDVKEDNSSLVGGFNFDKGLGTWFYRDDIYGKRAFAVRDKRTGDNKPKFSTRLCNKNTGMSNCI